VVGARSGAFCAARWPQSKVFAVDVNPRAVQLADLNRRRNDLANVFASCGDGFSAFEVNTLDSVAVNPPVRAGNAVIEKVVRRRIPTLRDGGELYVVLRTAQGAKSWQKRLAAQFGECRTLEMRAGYRILHCAKAG
jgi:16S rRNA (guanine1207-N2)-methyltransferase